MALVYKSGKLAINGGDVAYRLYPGAANMGGGAGGAPPVVLIAGWASVMNDWFAFPQEIAKKGRSVLVFDHRGIGESADHKGKIGVEELAADTLSLAEALLPAGPFVAFGHSAGAFVAQHLALNAPDRVAAAIFSGGQGARKTATQGAGEFFKVGRNTWHDSADIAARAKLLAYFIDTKQRDMVNRTFNEICKRSLKEVRPKATIQAQLGMLAKADYGPRLAEIRCPTLVISGASDAVIPWANAEKLHEDLAASSTRKIVKLPGLHFYFGPSQRTAITAASEVMKFLSETDGQRSKL